MGLQPIQLRRNRSYRGKSVWWPRLRGKTILACHPHSVMAAVIALTAALIQAPLATVSAQQPPAPAAASAMEPTAPMVACPDRADQDFVSPPELVSKDGVLSGTVALGEEFQQIPLSVSPPAGTGTVNCLTQLGRAYRRISDSGEKVLVPHAEEGEPTPGPTLRARVGDLVQLTFINQVDASRFEGAYGTEECNEAGEEGSVYPGTFGDAYPNCLHASNTANIHFHGTHTNPNSTGDNVYLQIQPLPRNNQGKPTTTSTEVLAGFKEFFERCTQELGQAPLKSWPTAWSDLPKVWAAKQNGLLLEWQQREEGQPLWTENEKMHKRGIWPIYYIGAFPYCFALPAYTADDWPPPQGSTSPMMGQAPGTHWYHAHKHGSTAINVMEGMTGAFIIEGKYDDDLNDAYGGYVLDSGPWNTHAQKVLVLNQLGTATGRRPEEGIPEATGRPNALIGGNFAEANQTKQIEQGLDFSINGRLRPRLKMQPGEIQLWRIVNTSARTAAYFMAPDDFEWRQIAQDGVQFTFQNYENSHNKPFYMAPANRVDLLVKAPMAAGARSYEVRIQNVLSRSSVRPTPINPTQEDPVPGTVLLTIDVNSSPPMRDNQAAEMPFLVSAPGEPSFPEQPKFLADITDDELRESNEIRRTLVFNSKAPGNPEQHTINDMQFERPEHRAILNVALGATEEWTVKNLTNTGTGLAFNIDHPLHIHINPFQVTEVFDPNEKLIDPESGKLVAVLDADGRTQAVPLYVTDEAQLKDPNNAFARRQCYINPRDEATWSVRGARMVSEDNGQLSVTAPCRPQTATEWNSIWWDVFAIPSGRSESGRTIPGYYKMRSRFVDYPGVYVMHCHILIHEDRGMMFRVEVLMPKANEVPHH